MPEHLPDGYTALIVGGGGIGRATARRIADDPRAGRLIVSSRSGQKPDMPEKMKGGAAVEFLKIDASRDEGLLKLAEHLGEKTPVHLLFNTVGVLHDRQDDQPDHIKPEKRLEALSFESLSYAFHINAAVGAMLLSTLAGNLAREPAIIASLSARVGSIGDNGLGGWYAYRAAKAAHNMLMKTAAIELSRRNRDSIVICLHPGTTDTELSRPFQENVPEGKLFTPDFVADRLFEVISDRTPEESGTFWDWNNQPIQW